MPVIIGWQVTGRYQWTNREGKVLKIAGRRGMHVLEYDGKHLKSYRRVTQAYLDAVDYMRHWSRTRGMC